jgi:hypothetical protein
VSTQHFQFQATRTRRLRSSGARAKFASPKSPSTSSYVYTRVEKSQPPVQDHGNDCGTCTPQHGTPQLTNGHSSNRVLNAAWTIVRLEQVGLGCTAQVGDVDLHAQAMSRSINQENESRQTTAASVKEPPKPRMVWKRWLLSM